MLRRQIEKLAAGWLSTFPFSRLLLVWGVPLALRDDQTEAIAFNKRQYGLICRGEAFFGEIQRFQEGYIVFKMFRKIWKTMLKTGRLTF